MLCQRNDLKVIIYFETKIVFAVGLSSVFSGKLMIIHNNLRKSLSVYYAMWSSSGDSEVSLKRVYSASTSMACTDLNTRNCDESAELLFGEVSDRIDDNNDDIIPPVEIAEILTKTRTCLKSLKSPPSLKRKKLEKQCNIKKSRKSHKDCSILHESIPNTNIDESSIESTEVQSNAVTPNSRSSSPSTFENLKRPVDKDCKDQSVATSEKMQPCNEKKTFKKLISARIGTLSPSSGILVQKDLINTTETAPKLPAQDKHLQQCDAENILKPMQSSSLDISSKSTALSEPTLHSASSMQGNTLDKQSLIAIPLNFSPGSNPKMCIGNLTYTVTLNQVSKTATLALDSDITTANTLMADPSKVVELTAQNGNAVSGKKTNYKKKIAELSQQNQAHQQDYCHALEDAVKQLTADNKFLTKSYEKSIQQQMTFKNTISGLYKEIAKLQRLLAEAEKKSGN